MPDASPAPSAHRVVLVDGPTALPLRTMTFPAYRWLLPGASPDGPVFVFAITPPGIRRVVGMAMVRREGEAADLLSMYVAATQRRQGLANRLLEVAEATLPQKGIETLGAVFDARTSGGGRMVHLLQRRGWSAPELRYLSFKSDFAHALEAPWMRQRPPPAGTALVPWSAVAETYRARIADPGEVPDDLHPDRFVPHAHDGAPLEPAGSFALLEGEALVGWVLCHRIHCYDARITASYIHPRHAPRFASGPLWRAAILGLNEAGYLYAVWAQSARYPGLIAFARRHIAPIAIKTSEVVHMGKRLAPADGWSGNRSS